MSDADAPLEKLVEIQAAMLRFVERISSRLLEMEDRQVLVLQELRRIRSEPAAPPASPEADA